ncbi:MAG: hypothetical protein A2487_14550 [Candidatus Raymondbacteria bacterium RifOxyC12_full_50_8]|uniref:N-acetyltransferase domain-containing protein n=1 Tax=Candidatus Raymondbacteria bacterium RIFOXYD12_FULL_49_13 TaxID=1817890 RepID=A0A1F7F641_UNCRA|nr:MAG: hypothetical protein A2248_03505 [Candidatus Raymondbacteria bacterium RIFOXYA2_FULL_49_16]OGJ99644.1 MAG: hypothetical protein A2350_16160 [Candidatus Raymondbacteria bacterium RifOxyB12_full_50_8]OGK02135.1 MAG: hypothetical protein A2519_18920 [Candidatus Raymondbacteria bacterium RIFOXYD12_FULL_49_13]OGK06862.1 MAG: hypothetical protein A2487_14550 [Candidatus Raymondbacteria bacterium RifOxyC12_full_50_8]OGP42520.1 MAG: hypothetical protein A2324_17540 [Candidatus Raymondbacteria b
MRYEIVTKAPIDAIVSLYQEAGWWQESAHSRDIIPAMIAGSFCFMVVKTDTGGIAGMGRVVSDGASDAYIQDIVVAVAFRGKGIGRELVTRLAAFCRERAIEWICLLAQPGTKEFYARLGFKEMENYVPMRIV